MTVRFEDGAILLEGACPVDEAETLLEMLLTHPGVPVDWSACRHLHTAVLQVMMASGRAIQGQPDDPFLAGWVRRHLP